jgi:hypothetical protein
VSDHTPFDDFDGPDVDDSAELAAYAADLAAAVEAFGLTPLERGVEEGGRR